MVPSDTVHSNQLNFHFKKHGPQRSKKYIVSSKKLEETENIKQEERRMPPVK
jgi:hypothetical protein